MLLYEVTYLQILIYTQGLPVSFCSKAPLPTTPYPLKQDFPKNLVIPHQEKPTQEIFILRPSTESSSPH